MAETETEQKKVHEVTCLEEFERQFAEAAAKGDMLIVVDWFALWCGPCKRIAPEVDKLADEHKDVSVFLKVNIEIATDLAGLYDISKLPTFMLFRTGDGNDRQNRLPKPVAEIQGADVTRLRAEVAKWRPSKTSSSNSNNINTNSKATATGGDEKKQVKTETANATFAAGCFWSVELQYQRLPGVLQTQVGYTGGDKKSPTYEQVCTGNTGHVEAVRVDFDPTQISYQQLLDVFWAKHDPTSVDRQGNDRGSQYRSAIFYHSTEQRDMALESKRQQQRQYRQPIVTEIRAANDCPWYAAEEYHQRYLEKGGQCAAKGSKEAIRCYG